MWGYIRELENRIEKLRENRDKKNSKSGNGENKKEKQRE